MYWQTKNIGTINKAKLLNMKLCHLVNWRLTEWPWKVTFNQSKSSSVIFLRSLKRGKGYRVFLVFWPNNIGKWRRKPWPCCSCELCIKTFTYTYVDLKSLGFFYFYHLYFFLACFQEWQTITHSNLNISQQWRLHCPEKGEYTRGWYYFYFVPDYLNGT